MKRIANIILAIAVLIPSNYGCGDKGGEQPQSTLTATLTYGGTIAWNETTKNLSITAPGEWTIAISYPAGSETGWCVPTETSGPAGNSSVWLQITTNTSLDDRTANITVSSQGQSITLTLTQTGRQGIAAEIRGGGTVAVASFNQTQFVLEISTTSGATGWEISMTSGSEWCTPSQSAGAGSASVTFTFAQNNSRQTRSAVFNVLSGAGNINGLRVDQLALRPELPAIIDPEWFMEYYAGEFALEYMPTRKHSKWVAWTLHDGFAITANSAARTNYWQFDSRLDPYNLNFSNGFIPGTTTTPPDFQQQSDYFASGTPATFDRGHMCPSNDRRNSVAMNRETFYYSNMSPQNGPMNQGIWGTLESRINGWAMNNHGDTLYICCGGTVVRDSDIGAFSVPSGMAIPKYFFKVVLRKKADGTYSSIGFWFENRAYPAASGQTQLNTHLDAIIRSVREVETATGFDFFRDVFPASLGSPVEDQKNRNDWAW